MLRTMTTVVGVSSGLMRCCNGLLRQAARPVCGRRKGVPAPVGACLGGSQRWGTSSMVKVNRLVSIRS